MLPNEILTTMCVLVHNTQIRKSGPNRIKFDLFSIWSLISYQRGITIVTFLFQVITGLVQFFKKKINAILSIVGLLCIITETKYVVKYCYHVYPHCVFVVVSLCILGTNRLFL